MFRNLLVCLLIAQVATGFNVVFDDTTVAATTVVNPGQAVATDVNELNVHGNKVLIPRTTPANITYSGKRLWNKWFDLAYYPISDLTNSVNITNFQQGDVSIDFIDNSIYRRHQIVTTNSYGLDASDIAVISTNTGYEVDSNNILTHYKDDSQYYRVRLTASKDGIDRYLDVTNRTPTVFYDVVNLDTDTGSARNALRTKAFSIIENETNTFPSRYKLWSTMDHDNTNYVWNTDSYFYGEVDLTCISPWSSAGSNGNANKRISQGSANNVPTWQFRTATLITPKHAIAAAHFSPVTGPYTTSYWKNYTPQSEQFQLRFVAPDGTVHQRIITDSSKLCNVENSGNANVGDKLFDDIYHLKYQTPNSYEKFVAGETTYGHDIVLLRLDSPLPDTIKPAKVLPANFYEKIPHQFGLINNLNMQFDTPGLPLFYLSAERHLYLDNSVDTSSFWNSDSVFFSKNYNLNGSERINLTAKYHPEYHEWGRKTTAFEHIEGDSGNAIGMILDNDFIITGTFLYPTSSGGDIHWAQDRIHKQFQKWGDSETLTQVDLSAYPTYNNDATASGTVETNLGTDKDWTFPFQRSRDEWSLERLQSL